MIKIKEGDIVFVYRNPYRYPRYTNIVQKCGKVVEVDGNNIGVQFDFPLEGDGNDAHGNGKYPYCWFVEFECLIVMEKILSFI